MRLIVCVLILFANFGISEGSSHKRKIKRIKKATRDMVTEKINEKGSDNVPYWYILCQNDIDHCLDPVRHGGRHTSHMIFETKKCEHSFWEWSDCHEMCYRNNLTPGNVWENCVPYQENIFLSSILLIATMGLILTPFIFLFRI